MSTMVHGVLRASETNASPKVANVLTSLAAETAPVFKEKKMKKNWSCDRCAD